MDCIKCGKGIPDAAPYCCWCGKKQQAKNTRKNAKRGNSTGSVYRDGNTWTAEITKGYRIEGDKKKRVIVRKKGFHTKKEALESLPTLFSKKEREKNPTFRAIYEQWLPTHRAGKDTMNCYKAAMKYFREIEFLRLSEIEIDDLQECIDECPHGKRTRENMKALCGLMYKYAIPRGMATLNLAEYLVITAPGSIAREGFNAEQLEKIRRAVHFVPYADYIYAMCYLGFRPSELLALEIGDYNAQNKTLVGGAKVFYPALEAIGIENPVDNSRHKYTPHSCRHTFATLMKRVNGADKDKQELIGHASPEMLRYYQDVNVDDLRKITDAI